jgi:hypothetical protein
MYIAAITAVSIVPAFFVQEPRNRKTPIIRK